jgi:hypothetical protein
MEIHSPWAYRVARFEFLQPSMTKLGAISSSSSKLKVIPIYDRHFKWVVLEESTREQIVTRRQGQERVEACMICLERPVRTIGICKKFAIGTRGSFLLCDVQKVIIPTVLA